MMPFKLNKLKRVSPSTFIRLNQCPLQVVLSASEIPQLLPNHPNSKLGLLLHKMVELCFKGEIRDGRSFERRWEKEISNLHTEMRSNDLDQHFVPLSNSARNYAVKKQQCRNFVEGFEFQEPIVSTVSPKVTGSEKWVESEDKSVGGRIDEIRLSHGAVKIVDLKTGKVFDDSIADRTIKLEYQTQMKLYAALYFETVGSFPSQLLIKTLDGQEHDIAFEREECLSLLQTAKARLEEINAAVESSEDCEELANPSLDVCRYCRFRPVCEPYWRAKESNGWDLTDVSGKVIDIVELKNGFRVDLVNDKKTIVARGLKTDRNKELRASRGKLIRLLNLKRDSSENKYREGPFTVSFIFREEEEVNA